MLPSSSGLRCGNVTACGWSSGKAAAAKMASRGGRGRGGGEGESVRVWMLVQQRDVDAEDIVDMSGRTWSVILCGEVE